MASRGDGRGLREHARGVGYAVLTGAAIVLVGLLAMAAFVWALA